MERFKELDYKGYKLAVSDSGRIFRGDYESKISVNPDGYEYINVGKTTARVHRLVALAFIHNDDPEIKLEVNHIDFNRKNNHYSNLEWMSHIDNVRYSRNHGRYKCFKGKDNPNYGNRKLSKFYRENPQIAKEKQSRPGSRNGRCKPIALYRDGSLVRNFDYIRECLLYLHNEYNIGSHPESFRSVVSKRLNDGKEYKGFTFKYI